MTDVRVVKWGLLLAIGVSGCVGARSDVQGRDLAFFSADPARQQSIAAMIGEMPTEGEDIVRRHLASGPESSVFLIRIPGDEEPHRHTRYDLTVMVVEGEGTLWLDGAPLAMRRGDVAHIPKDVPHYFINTGAGPATALGVFSPKFTGPDSAPVR